MTSIPLISQWVSARLFHCRCKPFTKAEVRYYPPERDGEARDWVREGLGPEI